MKTAHDAIREAVRRALADSDASPRFHASGSGDDRDLEVRLDGGKVLLASYYPGIAPSQVPSALAGLREKLRPGQHPALCVRQLSWPLLNACRMAGIAIFDSAGNAWLKLSGIYIERLRPSNKKGPEPTSGTVYTAKASRVVRAFLNRYPAEWKQAELVRETGLSAGYVSTLTRRLIAQEYVREDAPLLWLDDPERLLDDWLAHYRFDRHRKHAFALSAGTYDDGIKKLDAALRTSGIDYAWTGWTGAHIRAPYASPSTYNAYVTSVPHKLTGLFPVESNGNVLLYLPQDEGVFQFSSKTEAGPVVSDAQLYLDLCRMPGRAKEQAEALRHTRLDFARKVR